MTDLGTIDLRDPDLYVGGMPYAELAALRAAGPVHWNPESDGAGFWAVLGFDDIITVSRQADLFSSAHENGGHRIFNENEVGLTGAGESAIGIPFISRDPPTHTQYRKFVMPALSPARLDGIEVRIAERVERLFAEVPLNETVNILPLLTVPLPLADPRRTARRASRDVARPPPLDRRLRRRGRSRFPPVVRKRCRR